MGQNQAPKIPVLIASSLKPLKDTRAWEKLGLSLRETNKYDLNIIGFSSKITERFEGARIFTSLYNKSSTWERVFSQMRFLRSILKVRPKILIVCTYDYLLVSSLLKRFYGYKLIYDVQENYVLNLELNTELSDFKKSNVTRIIQNSESIKGIDFYFLAEKCYEKEMQEKQPFLILENKFAGEILTKSPFSYSEKKTFRFLISGTITPAFGTIEGINFFNSILKMFPGSSLHIVGHVPLKSFRIGLENKVKSNPKIHLNIDENPIDHDLIIEEIKASDFCLLPYHKHPAIKDKMPTKLFECMALGTPVLISKNEKWESFLNQYQGGFSIDFESKELAQEQFLTGIQRDFFTNKPGDEILWSSQEQELLKVIAKLV
jgi:glycosyltransferase involved in cell wall biosynthesis